MSPSKSQTTLKIDRATLEQLQALRGPGESTNEALQRLLPDITVLGQRKLRAIFRRATRKNAQAVPDA